MVAQRRKVVWPGAGVRPTVGVRRTRSSSSSKDVFQITGAPRALTDDVRDRQRRYLISMSIRTVCFVLAIVVDGWLRVLVGADPAVHRSRRQCGSRAWMPTTLIEPGPAALGSGSDGSASQR